MYSIYRNDLPQGINDISDSLSLLSLSYDGNLNESSNCSVAALSSKGSGGIINNVQKSRKTTTTKLLEPIVKRSSRKLKIELGIDSGQRYRIVARLRGGTEVAPYRRSVLLLVPPLPSSSSSSSLPVVAAPNNNRITSDIIERIVQETRQTNRGTRRRSLLLLYKDKKSLPIVGVVTYCERVTTKPTTSLPQPPELISSVVGGSGCCCASGAKSSSLSSTAEAKAKAAETTEAYIRRARGEVDEGGEGGWRRGAA